MAWNQRPQGVGPTEGNISFSGGLSPRFATGNATSDAVQQAIAAIAQILRQRQQDKIANQLLAVDNAQPAVAVDGTQKGTGQPDTQLTQAMVQRNLGQGLPAQDSGRVPDRGGVEGLQWADLIHKRDQERMKEQWATEDRPLDMAYRRAQIAHLLQSPSDRPMTEYQSRMLSVHERNAMKRQLETDPRTKLANELYKTTGLTADQLQNLQNVDLTDESGNPIADQSTVEDAPLTGKDHKPWISADVPTPEGVKHIKVPRETLRKYVTGLQGYSPKVDGAEVYQEQTAPLPQQQGITKEQYDALPSGATYTAPDGSQRRKP